MKYAIYCRKSTDEGSGKQSKSIPDQILACIEHAKKHKLEVLPMPAKREEFESKGEIARQDNDPDLAHRRTFQEYRNLFIIKEQRSARESDNRPKRKKLVQWVKKGKIQGIISYSPDRQARNALEGGEIIDLVDKDMVSLSYVNFYFENSASGKMMLGVQFVISKQYSDNLSEGIQRGQKSSVEKGMAMGKSKFGYFINNQGYFEAHPVYFPLLQEAFHKRIYQKRTIEHAFERLISRDFKSIKANGDEIDPSKHQFYKIWTDPFYYGIHTFGENQCDLRQVRPEFQPVITEDEYMTLLKSHYGTDKIKAISQKVGKEEHEQLVPLPRWTIITENGESFSFSLPNKKRFRDKLNKQREKYPYLELADVVKPSQIRYICKSKNSKFYNHEIRYDRIEKEILKCLKTLKLWDTQYEDYKAYFEKSFDELKQNEQEELAIVSAKLSQAKKKRNEYIKRHMAIEKDPAEQEIYELEKKRFDKIIFWLQLEWNELNKTGRNSILELEALAKLFTQADYAFSKADYVQKRNLSKILGLNIVYNWPNSFTVAVSKTLEEVFFYLAGAEPWRIEHILTKIIVNISIEQASLLVHEFCWNGWGKEKVFNTLGEDQLDLYGFGKSVNQLCA